jgi:mannose-6-phosphate isomerase-like protein (cupin superfamily)
MTKELKDIKNLESKLTEAITSYVLYESGDTKYIKDHKDSVVKDNLSYGEWVATYDTFPTVKVDGLENILPIKADTVHLFVNNESNYSFDWHKDDVNVFLYVVKGKKTVYIESEVYEVTEGHGIDIPKGNLHKVYSETGTWALSIQI